MALLLLTTEADATTTIFFDSAQSTNFVSAATTSDTISSQGYLFTYSRDKLFTGGVGMTNPIGRMVRVSWPDGLEAQAITAGPTVGGAKMTIQRQDGQTFAISGFTVKLLGNTWGAGGAIEVMPMLDDEDGFPDPAAYNVTGVYGQSFTFNTPTLTNFDTYDFSLYVDFALTSLTVIDANVPSPVLSVGLFSPGVATISWPGEAASYALQYSTNLSLDVWTTVTNGISFDGLTFSVDLPTTASDNKFFRLKK